MISAYLFINLSTEKNDDSILSALSDIPEVVESYMVYGTYDVVILIRAKSTNDLKQVTVNSVRKLGFVHSTMTLISLDSFEK